MKKILSLGLVLVMILGMGVMPAFAAEGETTETETTTPNYVYYDSANWVNYETKSYGDGDGDNAGDFALGIWTYFKVSEDGTTASLSNSSGSRTVAALQKQALASEDTADYTTPAYRKLTLKLKLDKASGNQTLLWQGLEAIKKSTLVSETYASVRNYSSYTESLAEVDDEAIVLYLSNSLQGASKNDAMSLYPICVLTTGSEYEIEYVFSGTKIYAIRINGEWKTAMDGTDFSGGISCQSNVNLIGVESTGGTSNGCLGATTGFTFSKYKYEGLEAIPLEIPEVTSTNIDSVKSTGNVSITFNMPVDPTTVSLALKEQGTSEDTWYSRKMPTNYEYDEDTNTYSVSFADSPLHVTGTYQLTLMAGAAGTQAMTSATAEDTIIGTFKATDEKYFVNENFDLYNKSTNMHNSASDAYEIWTAAISGGYQNVANEIVDGIMHAQLKTTTESAQSVYFKYRAAKMPVVDKTATDVKTAEISFKFSNLPQGGYIDIYSQILSIYRDSTDGKTYLYAEQNTGGDIKIAPVPENEDVVMTINYSANDLTNRYNRKFYNIKINDTLYDTAEDGTKLSSLAITSQGFDCGIEMETGMNFNMAMFSLIKPASTGALTTAADLWVYEVKYSMYEKPAGEPDYDVSINKFSDGQIQVKAVEIAGKGASESVIVAAYDATLNKLLDIKVVPVNLPKLGDMKETFTLDTGDATNVNYRKFRFGSLEGLDPITGTADTTIQ